MEEETNKNYRKSFLIVLLVGIILLLIVVYFLILKPTINGYVIKKQGEASEDLVYRLLNEVEKNEFVSVNSSSGVIYLVPFDKDKWQNVRPVYQKYAVDNGFSERGVFPVANNINETWITTDGHVHYNYCAGGKVSYTFKDIFDMSVYSDINITSLLIWSKGLSNPGERALINGKDLPISQPSHIIHPDAEISDVPAARTGHLVILGLKNLNFLPDPYDPKTNTIIIKEVREEQPNVVIGAAHMHMLEDIGNISESLNSGEAHFNELSVNEAVMNTARGKIDYWETNGYGHDYPIEVGFFNVWSKMLNTGYKIPVVGGSDHPCIGRGIGSIRTYVLIEGDMTYEKFLESVKKGRTVVSDNKKEWLNFYIDGAGLGEEVKINQGKKLDVLIEGIFDNSGVVDIIRNGKIVQSINFASNKRSVKTSIYVNESSWIVVKSPYAMTSPIYVIVNKQPIRASAEDTCYLIRYVELYSKVVEQDIVNLGEDKEEALKAYKEAHEILEQRFKEAGGTSCKY